ncbi:hypothetical protein Y1Q_0008793 [Alligator mississippiensis]|uniref:Uncharacterized protein n=1 Tax=Alligator mississippiensis TaxID=8496 RepID=A0A151NA04_ALLMI|nr:hypothetical protein Y1Q_0008793 [Alligator mississippiensis]
MRGCAAHPTLIAAVKRTGQMLTPKTPVLTHIDSRPTFGKWFAEIHVRSNVPVPENQQFFSADIICYISRG